MTNSHLDRDCHLGFPGPISKPLETVQGHPCSASSLPTGQTSYDGQQEVGRPKAGPVTVVSDSRDGTQAGRKTSSAILLQ